MHRHLDGKYIADGLCLFLHADVDEAAECARQVQMKCEQCGKDLSPIDVMMGPICGKCARINHEEVVSNRVRVRGCPCACNSGGFCGGCGHAGCSGGINLR